MGILSNWKQYQINSQELGALVGRIQELSGDDRDRDKQSYKPLAELLNRIMKLSKKENEWRLYFDAVYYMLWLQKCNCNHMEVIKYAEIYYKESDLHMDEELPKYTGTDMAVTNTYTYDIIFEVYSEFAPVEDARMDTFMQRYKGVAHKYGKEYLYDTAEINLGIMYRNADKARAAARNFLKHEKERTSCYVCSHRPYLEHLLMTGQDGEAETMMLKLLGKEIPQKDMWCYKSCRNATPVNMYLIVFYVCLWSGRKETFMYFYEKYWKKLPAEERHKESVMLNALEGYFEDLDENIENAEDDVKEEKKITTLHSMKDGLLWWGYFTLLDRSGVHKVKIQLPELETDASGQADTLSVAGYMEDKADLYGGMFSQARAEFDYAFTKEAYRNIID